MIFWFVIWLIILTFSYFSIRKSNKDLAKEIRLLKAQLSQLQKSPETSRSFIEDEEKFSYSTEKQEKRIGLSTDEPVRKVDLDQVIQKSKIIKEKPTGNLPMIEPEPEITVEKAVTEKEAVDEKPIEPLEIKKAPSNHKPIKNPTKQEKKPRSRLDWELLIGGRWLNRIGALAIVIGLIFFIKYAFDHQLINNEMKVTLVTLIGLVFLWGGRRFHHKQLPIFGQGLIGAGVAILYLSVYASHNFYHFIDGNTSMILMSFVTLLAFQQALFYNSLAVSLLGWCGGYLTPFLVSVDEASTKGLFSYLALLSLGMILVSLKKCKWSILYHLTLVATYLIFFIYLLIQPEPSEWLLRIGFLLIFWLIFYGYELYYLTHQNQWPIAKELMAMMHSLILYCGIVWLLAPDHSDWLMESLILAGICYLLPLIILFWRKKLSQVLGKQVIRYGLTFCLFITIAPLYHWERFELILVWIIEAALIIWWATQKRLQWLTIYTLGFLWIVSMTLISLSLQQQLFRPIINLQFLSYLGLTGIFLFGAIRQHTKHVIYHVLHVAWAVTFWIGFSQELTTLLEYIQRTATASFSDKVAFIFSLVMFTSWIVYSLFLARIAIWKQIFSLTVTSWVLSFLGVLGLIIAATTGNLEFFTTVFWSRTFIFLIAIIAVYLQYRWNRNQYPQTALAYLYGMVILGFELLTLQIHDYFDYQLLRASNQVSLYYAYWIFLWIGWILYSLPLIWYGLKRKISSLINLSILFFGICILGIMIHGLQFKPISQFIPVWNIRFLMLSIAAIVAYCFYIFFDKQRNQKKIGFIFILFILLFELTNVEINDYFRHQLLLLNPTQALATADIRFTHPLILSIIWVLFSLPLIWLGSRHKNKWMIYAAWVVLGVGMFLVMLFGFAFSPVLHFTPIINVRSMSMLITVAVMLILLFWFKEKSKVRLLCSLMISLLLFELISVEVNDLFRLLLYQDQQNVHELLNLKQLTFSFAWIIYAIVLFAIGVWRKFPIFRWIAMSLIGLSTFKIFLYDLAFLGTLYRIFLFIGLGVILLLVSYVYQRYKHLFTTSKEVGK